MANPVLKGYTKTRNHQKTLRKTQKTTTIYRNQKNSKYQNTSYAGAQFLYLAWRGRGRFVSYATDQVHFKHEQPQVLTIESHLTIGTIQPTQDAASVL